MRAEHCAIPECDFAFWTALASDPLVSRVTAFAEFGAASVVNHGVTDTEMVLRAVRSTFEDASLEEKRRKCAPFVLR